MLFEGALSIVALLGSYAAAQWWVIFLALVVLFASRSRWRRFFVAKRGRVAQRTPLAPNHPAVLSPPSARRAAPRPPREIGGIFAVRELLGPAPREFAAELKEYLEVTPPPWLSRRRPLGFWRDELGWAYRDQNRIRRDGQVVWAAVVQANTKCFRPGPVDSPASVIYSPDGWFDRHSEALLGVARELFLLKGTDQNDSEAAAIARMLTNEMIRGMRMKVPARFVGAREVFHSSMMITRKHLPKGYLGGSVFPVWVDPSDNGSLLLVPAAYWPAGLTSDWDRQQGIPRVPR